MRRPIAFAVAVAIGLTAWMTIGTIQAGAHQPKPVTVHCKGYDYENDVWAPPMQNLSRVFWTFSACSDIAATGGSGTGALLSQTALGTTVLVTWSTGGTTTIFLDPPGPNENSTRGCYPRTFGFKFRQTGAVISDSTGLIKLRSFASQMCGYTYSGPQLSGVTWSSLTTFTF